MNRHARLRFGAVAILLLTTSLAGGPARAGSTATRCDPQGCIHVHCNSTGDRCYHYEDAHSAALAAAAGACARCSEDDTHLAGGGNHGRLVCDSDGDRCYRSVGARWNYREYYRRHGYRWDGEGR